jgi:subtilase-type serine protease
MLEKKHLHSSIRHRETAGATVMHKQRKTTTILAGARNGMAISVIAALATGFSSMALAQDANTKNYSVKFMAFNIWNLGSNSKIWDPSQKLAGNLVYTDAMKELLRSVSPDVLVLPELNNNNKTFNGKNLVDAFAQNTLDVMNSGPRKQSSFVTAQKNPDEGAKGNGSIFSSVAFQNLPGDSVRINPGNGFPQAVVTSVHLNYYDESTNRIREAKDINKAGAASGIPTVILGDFNAGDVSERGLNRKEQQLLVIKAAGGNSFYKKLANEYLALADTEKYRKVIQDAFPGRNIDQLSWQQWGTALEDAMKAGKDTGLQDETYPVADNLPVTTNILKKQYQLFQLERNREQFQPSRPGDGRATWTSDGEDSTNTWPSWDRVTIDHIMMSRPFAKWTEIGDTGKLAGNLSGSARLPSGGSLSDHEPVAQNLRWIGPQLENYTDSAGEKTRLVWGAGAYNFSGRNKEFYLTRNNNRNDVYLGQVADADGNPILAGLTLDEKKTLLDCKSTDARFQQAIKDYCIDDHSFIGETLVTDGGTIIIDEDAALGGRQANLRLAYGGLRVIGQTMHTLDRTIVLDQPGWIDIADAGNTVSADQPVTGSGSLTKLGDGALVLSRANSYTGGTIVDKGVLKSGIAGGFVNGTNYQINGGTLDLNGFNLSMSSLSGRGGSVKLGSALLELNQTINTRYDGNIDGSGGLAKSGNGWLVLNGQNSFGGLTVVNGGGLVVGDSDHPGARLAGGVAVGVNTTLSGVGTISDLKVASGGIIAPGNSIGTMSVTGNVMLSAGSTYRVEIDAAGSGDKIAASGSAVIEGANVDVIKALGNYLPGRRYAILSAAEGISGTFGNLTQNMPFLDLGFAYDPRTAYLDIARNDVSFPSVGVTPNERATAAAIESLGGGNAVYDAVVLQTNAEAARTAFGRLSGEVHASTKTALINDSHQLRGAVNDRIRAAFGDVAAVDVPVMGYGPDAKALAPADVPVMAAWGQAFGAWSQTRSNGNAAKLDQSTGGFVTGFDAALAQSWRLGVMAGYSRSTFDVDARGSSGNSDNYHVGVYGGGHWGALSLRSGLGYSWHSIETARTAAFSGFEEHLKADYDAATFQAFGEVGYRIDTNRVSFEPFANLAHVRVKTDGFTEKGGIAGLTARSETTDTTFTTLGLRASAPFALGATDVEARGTIGWQHAYGDITPASTLAFATGNAFSTSGVPIAEDTALVEAGVDFRLSRQATLGVSYTGQFGSGLTQNAVDAKLGVKF